MKPAPFLRLPLAAVLGLTLLVAIWAGLVRLGWAWPSPQSGWASSHGALMVSGFLSTLIALERAVALNTRPAFVAPLLGAIGALALILGLPEPIGPLLLTLSSAGLVTISVIMIRRHLALFTATLALGALALLIGNILWLAGQPIPTAVPWWMAFLVLTIVGERLELSRVTRPSRLSVWLFAVTIGLAVLGLLVSLADFAWGIRVLNLGFVALALWLARYDIARKTIRRTGITRYVAVNLLLGYGWLAIGGMIGLRHAGVMAGPTYDAWLHAIFLGFVFGMIFAHALIILPAISAMSIPFNRLLYGPTLLMQLGLIMRVLGDLASHLVLRRWGGLINGVAVLWFLLQVILLAIRARRRSSRANAHVAVE